MYRPENYQACIWFIDQVMPLLRDIDVRFVVAGNRPPKVLTSRRSERVLITGFVEDETPLFSHSMCFVSPLLTGAGIKVKNIEAISSGIPVLTNEIGIEGIPAINGKDFFLCKTPEDYSKTIHQLYEERSGFDSTQMPGKKMISESFNLDISFSNYLALINELSEAESK